MLQKVKQLFTYLILTLIKTKISVLFVPASVT